MVKKCRKCGCVLKPDENNNICENCRIKKKNQLSDLRSAIIDKKRKKSW